MLQPTADGDLVGTITGLAHPFSTTRLNALLRPLGLDGIALWGHGELGGLRWDAPGERAWRVRLGPNRAELGRPGLRLRITAPPRGCTVMLENLGPDAVRVRLSAPRAVPAGLEGRPHPLAIDGGLALDAPNGALALIVSGSAPTPQADTGAGPSVALAAGARAVVAAAADLREARRRADAVSDAWQAHQRAFERHDRWLRTRLEIDDPLLATLMAHTLHAATSSEKRDDDGTFAGLAAGHGYAVPARSYFRDGYWTSQALLPFAPELVREQALLLGSGVHADGEAPSGVIHASAVGERVWASMLARDAELRRDHRQPGEWWTDHFDSPWLYALLVWDYIAWTGDRGLLQADLGDGRRVRDALRSVLHRTSVAVSSAALPEKPLNDRDWADNVFRSGSVAYDVALAYGAVKASLPALHRWEPALHAALAGWLHRAPQELLRQLWLPGAGHLAEYRRPDGSLEPHLALDSVVAVRYGMLPEPNATEHLAALCRELLTRHNRHQPYGDWGVMCAYPAYGRRNELRGKTRFPYRYHNGSDWPYLDGLLAEELLRLRHPDAGYALTRWWRVGLDHDWSAPVEYFSPPFGRGSPLQGWSSTPARAIVSGAFGIGPERTPTAPPWPDASLNGVHLQGKHLAAHASDNHLEIKRHD